MDFDEFFKFLETWVKEINDYNKKNKDNFILLDKDYFLYNKKTNTYSICKNSIEKWKNVKLLFIADNPGKLEMENYSYFYYDKNNMYNGYFRSAGYKYHKLLENMELNEFEVIKFNKCLIYTSKTSELGINQINASQKFVIDFIENFNKYNTNAFILFSGINGIRNKTSKFYCIYSNLKNILDCNNCGFIGHISRKKFPIVLNEKITLDNLKKLAINYKNYLFECEKNNNNANKCKNCLFYKYCYGKDNPDDLQSC